MKGEDIIDVLTDIRDLLEKIDDKLGDIKSECETIKFGVKCINGFGTCGLEDILNKLDAIETSIDALDE